MKKLFFVIAISMIFSISNAQLLKFGIKAGANSSSFKLDEIDSPDAILTQATDANWGFHAGVFLRIKIAMLYLQPEVYFTSMGGKYYYQDPASSAVDELKTIDMNRVDIPLLIGFKLGPIRINAGPSGHLVLSHSTDLEGLTANINGMTWGYQAGLGIDLFKKLTLDARYEGNLSSLGESVTIGGSDFNTDMRTSQFLVSLGWMF